MQERQVALPEPYSTRNKSLKPLGEGQETQSPTEHKEDPPGIKRE